MAGVVAGSRTAGVLSWRKVVEIDAPPEDVQAWLRRESLAQEAAG